MGKLTELELDEFKRKVKLRWLKRDENNKFYHGVINNRRRKIEYMGWPLTVLRKMNHRESKA